MTLFKRVLAEKRTVFLALLVAILVNIGVYAFVVYPLGIKSAGAASRAAAAAQTLKAAEQDLASARARVAGKSRADQELSTFYGKVLPSNQTAAVRLTYTPLPALARKANIRLVGRRFDPEAPKKDARVGRMRMYATLQGEYEGLRQFIFDLERAPEFLIIDHITLTQTDAGKPLTLVLELSTYYLLGTHAD